MLRIHLETCPTQKFEMKEGRTPPAPPPPSCAPAVNGTKISTNDVNRLMPLCNANVYLQHIYFWFSNLFPWFSLGCWKPIQILTFSNIWICLLFFCYFIPKSYYFTFVWHELKKKNDRTPSTHTGCSGRIVIFWLIFFERDQYSSPVLGRGGEKKHSFTWNTVLLTYIIACWS